MSTVGSALWPRILAAAWQQRCNAGSMRLFALLGAVAVVVLGVCAVVLQREVMLWLSISMLSTAVAGAWCMLLANLLHQNEPHAARLVPGHVGALRRVAGAVAAGHVVVAVAIALGFGLGALPALAIGLGTFAALLVLAWLVRWPLLGMFGWLVPASQSTWSHASPVRAVGTAVAHEWHREPGTLIVAGALACAALAAWSLRSVLQDGGERHRESYRRRVKARVLARGGQSQAATRLQQGRLGLLLTRWSTALYRWHLARVSARTGGDVLGRVLLGLGPTFHWTGLLGAALQLAVTWTLIAMLLIGTTRGVSGALLGPLTGTVLVYALFGGLTACRALHTTRREQALLALLPGLPAAAATLNRRLAARLLVGFFAWWAAGLVAALGLLPAGGLGQAWALTFSFASMPCAVLLCRDWSALRAPSPFGGFAPLFATGLLAAAAIALQDVGGVPLGACCAAFALAALALLAWRARRLDVWPAALPAARRGYSGSSVK